MHETTLSDSMNFHRFPDINNAEDYNDPNVCFVKGTIMENFQL
jgi:hypothetical protein